MPLQPMTSLKKILLLFLLFQSLNALAQPLRIMPMGNSITFDSNAADEISPRPIGQRISYRYKLYQLIKQAGYAFDFVGSENAGNDYFQNDELDDNAGFPGINKSQLANLIVTGYNQRIGQYEAPGPYLLYYPADVILLEIGTNDLDSNPDPVEQLLDNIRMYDQHVVILVSRITQRAVYSQETNDFNNNVEAMVMARNDPKIIMVNLESGAGINYSTDMADLLHPNTAGYNKIAAKWFEALDNMNTPPVVSVIPDKHALQGGPFSLIELDNYVTDEEDADANITWTYKLQSNSKFAVSIDNLRRLHASVSDATWYGSETMWLKATDSGNGSFKKSDSVAVKLVVDKSNEIPVITSTPVVSANEDVNYSYLVEAQDNDNDPLAYSVTKMPAWLNFSAATHILCGKPCNDNVGSYLIEIHVSDGKDTTKQIFTLTVNNVNDAPVVTSVPEKIIKARQTYQYNFTAEDVDVGDILTYSVISIPKWMTFAATSNGGFLFGIPDEKYIGANSVALKVSDGHTDVFQIYTLTVTVISDIDNRDQKYRLYPNPVAEDLHIQIPQPGQKKIIIYNLSGMVMLETLYDDPEEHSLDVSGLSDGVYVYKIMTGNDVFSGKFTKSSGF
jgi:hypothetical protein